MGKIDEHAQAPSAWRGQLRDAHIGGKRITEAEQARLYGFMQDAQTARDLPLTADKIDQAGWEEPAADNPWPILIGLFVGCIIVGAFVLVVRAGA